MNQNPVFGGNSYSIDGQYFALGYALGTYE